MSDVAGAQAILLSNSNKKSTAIAVSFENDGRVHIQSEGPVMVNGSTITLEAGKEGTINLHAKPATLVERLRVVIYLDSAAVYFDINNRPRLNQTAFSCRARAHRAQ